MKILNITGDEFYWKYCQKDFSVFDNIRYLNSNEMFKENHIVAIDDDGTVVGNIGIQENPFEPGIFWIKYISVHPEHRQRKIATIMLRKLFRLAELHGMTLQRSTPQPENYMETVFVRLREIFTTVRVFDSPNII